MNAGAEAPPDLSPETIARWLYLSDDRDLHRRWADAMWREAFRLGREEGYADGYREGREDLADEQEQAHRLVAQMVRETPADRAASAERRIRAAEAGCRRDAAWWWQEYHRRHGEPETRAAS